MGREAIRDEQVHEWVQSIPEKDLGEVLLRIMMIADPHTLAGMFEPCAG